MKHYPKIDGLRFVAIFLVLFEHFVYIEGNPVNAGYYGVDLFFIISGFLVTGILLNAKYPDFRTNYLNFIARRSLRIFPIYYLSIILFFIIGVDAVRQNIGYLLAYTFNYAIVFKSLKHNFIGHYWSLCVEEQFYLIWPLIALSLRNNIKALTIATLVIIGIGYGQEIFNFFPALEPYNYFGILTRMGSLGLGALGAIAVRLDLIPQKLFKNKFIEVFVFTVICVIICTKFNYTRLLLGLCSIYLIIKSAFFEFWIRPIESFLLNKTVRYIGEISYGIYLFHSPIMYYMNTYIVTPIITGTDFRHLGKLIFIKWYPWLATFPIYSIMSIGVAALSYRYVESPFLKLKSIFK